MLAIAAELGYSESAFLTAPPEGLDGPEGRTFTIRYFSPKAEVPFCGHATVATAVALAGRIGPGELVFATPAGIVPVSVAEESGTVRATLTSVAPHVEDVSEADLAEALAALDWPATDLDPAFPPRIAFAGARHLVLAASTRTRLAELAYDFARLEALMHRLDLTTVQLVWRSRPPSSTSVTRSPSAVSSRTRRRARRPPRSAPTPANSAWSPTTPSSPCTRVRTWAAPANSR